MSTQQNLSCRGFISISPELRTGASHRGENSVYLRRFERSDERTRTADLVSLRTIIHAWQGFADGCKCRVFRRFSLLSFAECCTVLRSRWYQSGVKPFEKLWSGVEIARPHTLGSHSYCKIYLKR